MFTEKLDSYILLNGQNPWQIYIIKVSVIKVSDQNLKKN